MRLSWIIIGNLLILIGLLQSDPLRSNQVRVFIGSNALHVHNREFKPLNSLWNNISELDKCSRILGNPFTNNASICEDAYCLHSPVLRSSNCRLRNFAFINSKIRVAKGGEPLEDVIGQKEAVEFPSYEYGSVLTNCQSMRTKGIDLPHYLGEVFKAVKIAEPNELKCGLRISEPTFAITRYDFANIYHTACDWYNFYQAIQLFGHRNSDVNVLLLDGHPRGSLDKSWEVAFGKVLRLSDFSNFSSVCFDELYLTSPGYKTPIFPKIARDISFCRGSSHLEDFSNSFLKKFKVHRESDEKLYIGYIFRKDYLAHPRQGIKPHISRKIANENELLEFAKRRVFRELGKHAEVIPLFLEKVDLHEQIRLISKCKILVGVHGAGLTHALFMNPKSILIEISPPAYSSLQFFEILSKAKGLNYILQRDGIYGPDDNIKIDLKAHEKYLLQALHLFNTTLQ